MNKFMNTSWNQLNSAFKSSTLFNNLNKTHLEELTTKYSPLQKTYSKGTIIYNENDLCRHMDLVISGTLIIQQIDEYGNMLSIIKFSKGQTIAGNILFSKNQVYPMTISADSDVVILPLSKEDVLNLCTMPIFLEALLMDISYRANILSHTIKNITRKSLRNKMIDYLIFLYSKQNCDILKLPITKTELANNFGVARPSISRELTKMQKDGLLTYNKKTIQLSTSFIQLYLT